jgi:hypothetical protein
LKYPGKTTARPLAGKPKVFSGKVFFPCGREIKKGYFNYDKVILIFPDFGSGKTEVFSDKYSPKRI